MRISGVVVLHADVSVFRGMGVPPMHPRQPDDQSSKFDDAWAGRPCHERGRRIVETSRYGEPGVALTVRWGLVVGCWPDLRRMSASMLSICVRKTSASGGFICLMASMSLRAESMSPSLRRVSTLLRSFAPMV